MFKSLTSMLSRKSAETPPAKAAQETADEHAAIYQELAMTEELREALFPKTPQMVSAIFDRPLPPLGRRPNAPAAPPAASDEGSFPIIF